MARKKIDQAIIDYEVARGSSSSAETSNATDDQSGSDIEHMHEQIERPEALHGSTYKIKTPLSEHALYVTINDVILNPGTEHELRRPFEIFINSKNMDHFQWIVALTRIISAVFRKGGDCTFLAEELRSVFDPRGGYFKKGGRFMPSLVAEIGDVIETHLRSIGMLDPEGLDEHQRRFIAQKRAEIEGGGPAANNGDGERGSAFPEGAQLCNKCQTKAMVDMDGCLTCLNCGESKCG
ncbi:NrdJb [Halorhodospira halochloris]|uniref:TSCPD domain-containing protein n=1 Tax=Halorhodospira halochloris TaxID=1052 RepID=UPI001EE78CBC|nr:NrdJb [Halorhodospira halochloris]MCG5548233.1 NrdJb [Halorhodospira halochloris]